MRHKKEGEVRPRILVKFHNNECEWYSDGWGNDAKLMRRARRAIENGLSPVEVVAGLEATFEVEVFEVIEDTLFH